ncbi:MAG TPA: PEP-CTERM sorting domain-containing protein [Pirellulales bacterium]|nr:PEP-CTERM sorting domain-containing protein [Pirellulales bacterium]
MDEINPNAQPLLNTSYAFPNIGWYYTPTQSYTLTGISTFFEPISSGTGNHSITVQIQSDRPANGGVLLDQATFSANSATGGVVGGEFTTAVALQAGQTYFVDFMGLSGMGTNLGQFIVEPDGTHVASAGATTRLAAFWSDGVFGSSRVGNAGDEFLPTGNASGLEPILYFDGKTAAVTPEPSAGVMMLLGLGTAAVLRRRRKRKAQAVGSPV